MQFEAKKDNINGILKRQNYAVGYVAAIDILGFSNFISDVANYNKARILMNNIAASKKIFENNFEHINFNLCSDTVFITIEVNDSLKFDVVYFESIVSKIGLIRSMILDELGLFSRSGITFGKYIAERETYNIIFGPAIVRAIELAEHIDKIEGVSYKFKNRPAAIYIDNIYKNYPEKDIDTEFLNGGIKSHIENNIYFEAIGNNYYIYNPYFEDYKDKDLRNKYCDKEFRILDFARYYIKKCNERINKIKEIKPEKVAIEKELLDKFIETNGFEIL